MKNMVSLLLCLSLISTAYMSAPLQREISAKAYVVLDAESLRIIEAKSENERLPMASTTKIMTALLTLEQPDLDLCFEVDSQAIKTEGTSMGLREGDSVTLRALAAGMLAASGNDGANAAAVRIGGSIEGFVEMMNERAEKIGMSNTHFETPSGLDGEEHFSTALDMALLASEAIRNSDFAELCSQTKVKAEYGNPPYQRWLRNHNRLLEEYDGCIGVKTGFTKKAGRCLVSAAERNGVRLICVTLSAPNDWEDHRQLLDSGFAKTQMLPIEIDCAEIKARVVGSMVDEISVKPLAESYSTVKKEELLSKTVMRPFFYAPIKKGDYVGEIRHYYTNGRLVAVTTLVADETAEIY